MARILNKMIGFLASERRPILKSNILRKEDIILKIIINISNYIDTIDIFVNGLKIDMNKLSLFSKAEFECDVKLGIQEIYIVKKSKISECNWKKGVVFDWISCLLGVPDWTLAEKALDTKTYSTMLKVEVNEDVEINLKLTENGFELTENSKNILDMVQQTETSKTANKRIKNLYLIPVMFLVIVIEICLLIAGVFFIVNSQYAISIIIFALAIFWAWLICGMILKEKK